MQMTAENVEKALFWMARFDEEYLGFMKKDDKIHWL